MNEQTNPNDGAAGGQIPDDLSVPELTATHEDAGELLTPTPEARVEEPSPPSIELPDDPSEAVPVLLSALGEVQVEAAGYLDTLQRVAAEFDNFRKRSTREREEIVDRASQRVIERLLPTLDSFDAALSYQAQTETEEKIIAGMQDTHRLFLEALAVDGFEPIAADGVPFDPAIHEAVAGPGGIGDGELMVREMRRGYTLRGRVVRAALVAVEHA
ncbi:MAG: nucleotide exchange factor GrpE [Acidimicrobiia bacterium]|nr:nucleotide exchange factor GrpE [Acidimicrobiia bacterium]